MNIIFSYDNNKGKTIVAQGLYYALGNEPIFPSGFEYKDYYFIVDLQINNQTLSVCRKNNTYLIKDQNGFNLFNSTSEFKRFFDKTIYKLPTILKDSKEKIADLELFFQLFFVGQDKRDTSKIFNSGYNKKDDFINMIYSLAHCVEINSNLDKDEIKNKIFNLKDEKIILKKQNRILSKNISAVNLASYTGNKEAITKKISEMEKNKDELISLKTERNRTYNKKIKNEVLLKELRSLNRTLSEGQLMCLDCDSKHIGYEYQSNELSFDVSDNEIRNNILEVIQNRIDIAEEEISKIDIKVSQKQTELNELIQDEDVSLENLLFYKSDLQVTNQPDNRIMEIDKEIERLNIMLTSVQLSENALAISTDEILNQLFEKMNFLYTKMDPDGSLNFTSLFTTKNQIYSGSEGSEYYLAKVYAFVEVLKHPFPIVMDSFREGELSSEKEKIIIENFTKISNQIIFTATLKDQEKNKYDEFKNINKLDYSSIDTCHLLNKKYLDDFREIIKEFSLNLSR